MGEKPSSAVSNPTRLTGAEIVWATLEGDSAIGLCPRTGVTDSETAEGLSRASLFGARFCDLFQHLGFDYRI